MAAAVNPDSRVAGADRAIGKRQRCRAGAMRADGLGRHLGSRAVGAGRATGEAHALPRRSRPIRRVPRRLRRGGGVHARRAGRGGALAERPEEALV